MNIRAQSWKFAGLALLALSGVFAGGQLRAQGQAGPALPTTQQVMERYVKALGGREAIFKHKSMTIREKLQVGSVSVDRVVHYKDGKSHDQIALPNGGQYQSGYDGTVAWEMSAEGAELMKGDEVKSKARDADMYYPARIPDYFKSLDVLEVSEFEGHTCYHLKGTNNWGIVNEHFYDTTTGLLVGYKFNSAWRGGPGDESEVFAEYKNFGGWLIPTRIDHKDPNKTMTEVVNSVTFDDVDDAVFTLPDSVKALVAKGQH
jgi:hypothetical protein